MTQELPEVPATQEHLGILFRCRSWFRRCGQGSTFLTSFWAGPGHWAARYGATSSHLKSGNGVTQGLLSWLLQMCDWMRRIDHRHWVMSTVTQFCDHCHHCPVVTSWPKPLSPVLPPSSSHPWGILPLELAAIASRDQEKAPEWDLGTDRLRVGSRPIPASGPKGGRLGWGPSLLPLFKGGDTGGPWADPRFTGPQPLLRPQLSHPQVHGQELNW